MSYSRVLKQSLLRAGLTIVPALTATAAYGANECSVQYGYHTGSGFNRSDKVKTVNLNAGQSQTVNQNQMNFVKNTGNYQVTFALQGASNVTLDKNQVNPPAAYYLTPVTLQSISCSNQISAGAFGTPQALVDALKLANKSAEYVAQALKDTFNLGAQQVAQLLRAANYSAQQVAAALKAVYGASVQQIAQWLKAAGYAGEQVAAALKAGANASVQAAAGALSSAFNASVSQLAQWLKGAGYSLIEVARALESVETDEQKILQALRQSFNVSVDQLVQTIKQTQKVITALNCSTTNCEQPATWLKNINYPLNDVLKALKTHYNISAQAAYAIAENVYGAGITAIEQALAFAGYSASQIGALVNQGATAVGRSVRVTTRNTAEQSALGLYDAYFRIVAAGARMVPLHERYRDALNGAGISVGSVRIGYSRYLDPSNVAMTNCNNIYFPENGLVQNLNRGRPISESQLHWLLHELGHTVQCRSRGRRAFANRWFGELSPAVTKSIEAVKPNAKAIHDAMPLEQEADAHASRHLRNLKRALRIR